jgi:hypothetical protein
MAKVNETISKGIGEKERPACEVCGNDFDRCFEVRMGNETHVFDSFECAIHALAPVCAHCGCRIIGHGVESQGLRYCCAYCATQEGTHAESEMERKPG